MSRLASLLLVALCACSAVCLAGAVGPSPVASAAAATAHSTLDRVHEAVAHPLQAAPALSAAIAAVHEAVESVAGGSLHAAQERSISPQARARAANFVQHIESLITTLKHRAQLNRLSGKYDANATRSERIAVENSEQFEREAEMEEAEAEDGPRAAADLYVVPEHEHVRLDVVEPLPEPRASDFSDSPYVLHPVNIAPKSPSPSGLNFTTFDYPTKQGTVTIWVGITEFPMGKFHFFPAPRDADDFILVQRNENHLATLHASAQGRKYSERRGGSSSPMEVALGELRAQLNPLCDGVAATSVSANHYGCELAMNAGFFNMATGACMGDVISNGQIINRAEAAMQAHSHFGLTRKGNFVTGYLTPAEVGAGVDGGFHELAQGNGWLIREGKRYINESAAIEGLGQAFLSVKAPRNAIGHDSRGRLLQFEADGEEDIDLGLTLWEFADILATHFDVVNAVNVDGGGSSTTVFKGKVVSRPTCRDTPDICERSVTTISCVMP